MTDKNNSSPDCRAHSGIVARLDSFQERFDNGEKTMDALGKKIDSLRAWVVTTMITVMGSLIVALTTALFKLRQ